MDNLVKNSSKIFIIVLTLIACAVFGYNYFYDQRKSNQTLIIEKKPIKARLVELKMNNEQYLVKIQDTANGQIYDDVFVSKMCPLFEKNQPGKIMDLHKVVLYRVKEDLKEEGFEGLYDYICTNKKENEGKN